jgi:phage shock protein PspC (stress-responsive transcriptional regulator)
MNLSGIIFHIEEDAYDMLNRYLSTIKSYFKDSEGRDEIMNDIESRVAEMLQEKVSKTKQAVLMADVESVIAVMGKPEDFAGENPNTENTFSDSNSTATYASKSGRRRVFRDPDEKLLGGVCSGIANYFDFDPIWLRGAFAISFFIFGSGFLLYLILWIIIPEAKTTAEKLEMHGEKVDINNISKAVNEEFEELKKKVKDFGSEVNSRENKQKVKSSARKASEFAGDVLRNIIRILGKIVAIFSVFIGIALLVALLATIFGSGTISVFNGSSLSNHFSLYEFCSMVLPADLSIQLVIITIILFLGVPLLSLIYAGIRHLFGIKQKNKIVKYTANILWIIGVILVFYVGSIIGSDFSQQANNRQKIEIKQPSGDILYLDLKPNPDEDIYHSHHNRYYDRMGDWIMIFKDENKFRIAYPEMSIVASETDSFELVAVRTSFGYDKKEAVNRAKNIGYSIAQNDSLILFDSFFDLKTEDKLRAQELKIILKVPVNKSIYLSKRMEKIIFDIDNVNDALDSDMVERRWIMTKQGLKCVDCDGLENARETISGSELNHDSEIPPPPLPPAPKKDSKKYFLPTFVTFD